MTKSRLGWGHAAGVAALWVGTVAVFAIPLGWLIIYTATKLAFMGSPGASRFVAAGESILLACLLVIVPAASGLAHRSWRVAGLAALWTVVASFWIGVVLYSFYCYYASPVMMLKQVGMIVVYEVDTEKMGVAEKLNAAGIQALTAALDRRLNPGHRKSGRVRALDDGRVEVSIFRAEAGEMQRIADLLSRPGTLEFRILANERDHPHLIARAQAKPESKSLSDPGGQLLAWWVPAQGAAEKSIGQSADLATRTAIRRTAEENVPVRHVGRPFRAVATARKGRPTGKLFPAARLSGDREVLEVLVVKDSFDVTGSHLKRAAVGTDHVGKPCVEFAFGADGAQRFGDLTGGNLPDHDFHRALGIILDGQLASAPRIMSKVSERGLITGDFTREEAQDIVDLLNAGSLPAPIRKVEQRMVDIGQQPSP